jgi:broad specificity phosphatase PhoE
VGLLRYTSHANVAIEPNVPMPRWHLSDVGRERVRRMLGQPWVTTVRRVVSSSETKAIDTAQILADHLGLDLEIRPGTGEIDRSSTGFVPPERHEELADLLFARPYESAAGWERAIDAQARIVGALRDVVADSTGPDTVIIGHGGVGTLLYCYLTSQPIDRRHDQPDQGHYFTVDLDTGRALHPWRAIDDLETS